MLDADAGLTAALQDRTDAYLVASFWLGAEMIPSAVEQC